MPHLNELNEKYAEKGLTVLGVTSEGVGQTEPWIEEKGAKYAYAYDKGSQLSRWAGVTGIPNALLVDPSGRVVWQGNPGGLTNDTIERALAGALPTPVYEWPSDASAAAKAFGKRQMKKAIDAAAKLDDQTFVGLIQANVDARVAGLKSIHDAGDFLTATDLIKLLKKDLAGLDAVDQVDEVAKAIAANKDAKSIMKGQAKVRKLREEPLRTAKDVEERIEEVEKIADRFSGNAAGDEANAYLEELRKMLG